MSAGWVVAIVLAIGAIAYFFAAQRARLQRDGTDRAEQVPHSLPTYHGWLAFIFTTLPAKGLITDIECEARDREQIDALVEGLRANGYSVSQVELA